MSEASNERTLSRAELLRLAALGAGGAGLALLAGCEQRTAPAVTASEPERGGYVVAVTHGPKDPTRVMLALTIASRLPAGENHVWFAIDGGELCLKGEAEKIESPLFTKQGNAAKLIEQIRGQGTAVHI